MYLKAITINIALVLCTAMVLPAAAAPRLIGADAIRPQSTTFSLFFVDLVKVGMTSTTAQATLNARLAAAGEGLTSCLLTGDVNANNINCGNGLMRLGSDFFSTTIGNNHVAPTINWLPEDNVSNLDKTTIEYAVNGRSTLVNTPMDASRPFKIRFNKRIAQFGFVVDPFLFLDPTAPLDEGRMLDGLQFIVNGQATPVRDFTNEQRGNVHFTGVEDPHGFTEVTVIGTGLGTIKLDRYTIVPLNNF
jgi:hypothetical protein